MATLINQGVGALLNSNTIGKNPVQTASYLLHTNSTQSNNPVILDNVGRRSIGVSQSIVAGTTTTIYTGLNPPENLWIYYFVVYCLQSTPLTLRDGATDIFAFGVQGSVPFVVACPTLPLQLFINNGAVGINNPSGGNISISWTLFAQFDNG